MARFAKEADRPGMSLPTALAVDTQAGKPKDLTNQLQRISGSSQAAEISSTALLKP